MPEDMKVVEVEKVKLKDIRQTTRLIGTLKPKNSTMLVAKSNGVITALLPAGKRVPKGTMIAKIDNNDLEKNYALVESAVNIAKTQYDRLEVLFKSGHSSKKALEERKNSVIEAQQKLANAKIQLDNVRFYAPFDGIIGVYKVHEGAQVREGDQLVSFYDPTAVTVEFNIPAPIINYIKDGQPVSIGGRTYGLTHVQKIIDETTHMCPAYVDINCQDCALGANVELDLIVQQRKNVVVIPFEAVFLKEGKTKCYLVKDSEASITPITLGIREKTQVEVTSGLKAGDTLILRGQARLYPGVKVKIFEPKPNGSK